jgi:hypothetical protein
MVSIRGCNEKQMMKHSPNPTASPRVIATRWEVGEIRQQRKMG